MPYLFSFSRYQTKRVIEFLFTQFMISWTLRFIFDHPQKQRPTRQVEKERRTEIQKYQYLDNEKSFLNEIESIFESFWRAIIWWKNKNLMKVADTSFKAFNQHDAAGKNSKICGYKYFNIAKMINIVSGCCDKRFPKICELRG